VVEKSQLELKESRIHLNADAQAKLSMWLFQNKDEILKHRQKELCRKIMAAIGIRVNPFQLSRFERALGIERKKGANMDVRRDRIKCVAQHVQALYESLGIAVPTDLLDIQQGN